MQKFRGDGGAPDGQVKHCTQKQQHGGNTHKPPRQQPVQQPVPPVGRLLKAQAGGTHFLRQMHSGSGDSVPEIAAGEAAQAIQSPGQGGRLLRLRGKLSAQQGQGPVSGTGQQGQSLFHRGRIGDAPGARRRSVFRLGYNGPHQLRQAPAPAGGGAHHRTGEQPGQGSQVNLQPVLFRLVQQIYTHHQPGGDLPDLQDEIQVSAQAGGVCHGQGHIRRTGEKVIPGHLLLGRAGSERISAGQVHQVYGAVPGPEAALRQGHRFARPVSRVLVQPRQGVENRGFAHIGIARQGHRELLHVRSSLPQIFPQYMPGESEPFLLFVRAGAYTACVLRGSREEEAI